ncbi:MAG: B12-binding domain-containing radical SAM protein [Candidatus Brocadiaceae bacterium]|nr:B12-binding domain-containing radical SAM protein [Candidatus Brocadiaceae bacterium]
MKLNQHRILLIEPPHYRLFKDTYSLDRYPLSLGYLAGTIRKETNWSVMAYNTDFCPQSESIKHSYLASTGFDNYLNNLKDLSGQVWREVKSTISEYKPTVVGISAKSQNFTSACIVAKFVKEVNDQTIVIVGGPHPSMVESDVLNCPDIDVGVRGEGENTIVELLNAIEARKKFDDIRGIVYRKDTQIVKNAPREFLEDLDSLCFPHESAPEVLKDYDQYPLTAFRNIFATRGCPYNCFFCGSRKIWNRSVRFRSPENVVREIKGLQKMGLRSAHFDDDTFGVNKKYINDLCNALIIHCPGLKWSSEIHVKLVDEQTISLMKTAGCFSILIGIESGNNEILKEMRKNITIEEALSACEIIKKHGILLQAFFIVGFPQETEDTLNDTVAVMKKLNADDLIYSIFTPYPGTEAFEFCKERGLISDEYDVSLYNHQSPANCFCINIRPERFRRLVSKIEKMIDRKNSLNKIKQVFSFDTFRKIQELGIGKSFQKGIRVFIGK